jgi:thiamine pyrophosphokinase
LKTVIVANGDYPEPTSARLWLGRASLIIAADGGSHHCLGLGFTPDFLIGDLDSVEDSVRQAVQIKSGEIHEHPTRKDANDLELALDFALEGGMDDIVILGAIGGRWDQTLANWLLLAHPKYRSLQIRVVDGKQTGQLIRSDRPLIIEGRVGDTLSLIPMGGDAQQVTTAGLEYPLLGETLVFASSRGVSNRIIKEEAAISLTAGALLCLRIEGPV